LILNHLVTHTIRNHIYKTTLFRYSQDKYMDYLYCFLLSNATSLIRIYMFYHEDLGTDFISCPDVFAN